MNEDIEIELRAIVNTLPTEAISNVKDHLSIMIKHLDTETHNPDAFVDIKILYYPGNQRKVQNTITFCIRKRLMPCLFELLSQIEYQILEKKRILAEEAERKKLQETKKIVFNNSNNYKTNILFT